VVQLEPRLLILHQYSVRFLSGLEHVNITFNGNKHAKTRNSGSRLCSFLDINNGMMFIIADQSF